MTPAERLAATLTALNALDSAMTESTDPDAEEEL